ncbi:hypothetical protein CEXT_692911 [Caerostris extrusa]|uniref:Uncharacterized protein n=1 Tax=Caerostris extrusa TaxID=172846 RepID=A0AAV4UKF8_CAEEX|nr:hypothetical protein CEXT_692911 [Caerostris extrusa]
MGLFVIVRRKIKIHSHEIMGFYGLCGRVNPTNHTYAIQERAGSSSFCALVFANEKGQHPFWFFTTSALLCSSQIPIITFHNLPPPTHSFVPSPPLIPYLGKKQSRSLSSSRRKKRRKIGDNDSTRSRSTFSSREELSGAKRQRPSCVTLHAIDPNFLSWRRDECAEHYR